MNIIVLLWATAIASLVVAFFGGLCPRRTGSLLLRAISWFDVIVFGGLLYKYGFGPYFVGQLGLLIFLRSALVIWGTSVMAENFWKDLDFDPDAEHVGAFIGAVVSGSIAFWGFIVGLIIDHLIPYIIQLANG